MTKHRKIIHIDADCFYAAIEMRDNPAWRDRPLAVGGSAARRGVISTCNYEARTYGVRSAMASYQALKLCPQLLLVPGRMPAYKEASRAMHKIFSDYTDAVEPLSLDEAYLDVSDATRCKGSATHMAEEIRARIEKSLEITVSAGVANNKFLAKIASDWQKPNGLTVIEPTAVDRFVSQLAVSKIPGIGNVSAELLEEAGIQSCSDAQEWSKTRLEDQFGQLGKRLYYLCRGIDDRPVESHRERKSLSVEHTYDRDYFGYEACAKQLPNLMSELAQRLQKHWQECEAYKFGEKRIGKLHMKVKFTDFSSTTVECSGTELDLEAYELLLRQGLTRAPQKNGVRLLGVGVRFEKIDSHRLVNQIQLI